MNVQYVCGCVCAWCPIAFQFPLLKKDIIKCSITRYSLDRAFIRVELHMLFTISIYFRLAVELCGPNPQKQLHCICCLITTYVLSCLNLFLGFFIWLGGFTITITLFALEMLNCICMFVSLFTSFNIIGLTSYEMYACVAFFFFFGICMLVCLYECLLQSLPLLVVNCLS